VHSLLKEEIPIPSLPVQHQIAAFVLRERRLQQEVGKTVALLREYRTRLIADVVTGKLDVREAAAHLPGEAPELGELRGDEALGEENLDADKEDDAELDEEAA
jgi:type I restriction enzyme S subunit